MIDEYKLPIEIPLISGYSKTGAMSSILEAHKETKFWFWLNYTPLCYFREFEQKIFWLEPRCDIKPLYQHEWEICPYIKSTKVDYEEVYNNFKSFKEFVKYHINNNTYIYMNLYTKYILEYKKNKNRLHDMLISGYKENDFYCSDYFEKKYELKTISIESLEKSFYYKKEILISDKLKTAFLWKYNSYNTNLTEDGFKEKYYDLLRRILYTTKKINDNNNSEVYTGISVYHMICEDLLNKNLFPEDYRPFYIIYEHISLLCKATNYINKGNKIKEDNLKRISKFIYYLSIKYALETLDNKSKYFELIIKNIMILSEMEKNYIEEILR